MVPQLPPAALLVVATSLLVGAYAAAASAWRLTRTLRRLREVPSLTVAEARAGLVELNGTVQPTGEPLRSPITQRACVYWRFKVEQRKTQAVNVGGRPSAQTQWVSLVDDRAFVPCTLKDQSGEVALDLAGAQMVLTNTVHTQSGPFADVAEHLEKLLHDRYGKSTRGLWFTRSLRFTETLLCPGTPVYVVGLAQQGVGGLKVGSGDDVFVVSDRKAQDVLRRFVWRRALAVVATVVPLVAAVAVLSSPWWMGR